MDENLENDDGLLVPTSPKVPLKNIDKSLYLCSESGKFCPFCNKHYKKMVPHFKTQHPDSEVYCSRISPQMVDDIEQEKRSMTKFLKGSVQNLRAICLFCEEQKDFSPYYWIDHIRSHTGEYGNRCIVCSKLCSFYTHCGMTTMRAEPFDLTVKDFEAFRCLECNYVQINEENMDKHLEQEHGFTDTDDRYQQFILIPALRSLPLRSNPNDILLATTTGMFNSGESNLQFMHSNGKYPNQNNSVIFANSFLSSSSSTSSSSSINEWNLCVGKPSHSTSDYHTKWHNK